MTGIADLVEDHTGEIQFGIEGAITQQERRNPARHALTVDDQDNRRAQQSGQLGVAVGPGQVDTVEEPDIALDQPEIRRAQFAREVGEDLGAIHGVKIQVIAGTPGRLSQPERIDIVRPLFKRLNNQPSVAQSPTDADRQRGFTRRFLRGGDIEMGHLNCRSPGSS